MYKLPSWRLIKRLYDTTRRITYLTSVVTDRERKVVTQLRHTWHTYQRKMLKTKSKNLLFYIQNESTWFLTTLPTKEYRVQTAKKKSEYCSLYTTTAQTEACEPNTAGYTATLRPLWRQYKTWKSFILSGCSMWKLILLPFNSVSYYWI